MSYGAENFFFMGVIAGMFVLGFVIVIFGKRCTKKYRQEVSDMYVSSKIRDIANNGGLDINAEYNNFKQWNKDKKLDENEFSYDDVVEEELQEKVRREFDFTKGK